MSSASSKDALYDMGRSAILSTAYRAAQRKTTGNFISVSPFLPSGGAVHSRMERGPQAPRP